MALTAFIAGCGGGASQSPVAAKTTNECKGHRSSCGYEGAYDSGERDYAAREAKRLNLAQKIRLTSSTWQ